MAITSALKGAGGYGKTTLAKALCADDAIQDAYHDGILWVTLGESPGEPQGRIEDLIHVLQGRRESFATREAALARLAEILADRRCLLVIDDVWHRGDAEPFLQAGPRCARLLTTRNADTLPPDAVDIRVDADAGRTGRSSCCRKGCRRSTRPSCASSPRVSANGRCC